MPRTGRPKRSTDCQCICQQCGKEYSVPGWKPYGRLFCGSSCFHESRKGKPQPWLRTVYTEKVCPACGLVFECGGEGRPPRFQVHCSGSCNRLANKYRTTPKTLGDVDAAYIAGFLDGEGCISVYCRTKGVTVKMYAHNCKRSVLDWIAETTGLGSVQVHCKGNEKHCVSFSWQTNSISVVAVLKQVLPYLRLKKRQAELAIEAQTLQELKGGIPPIRKAQILDEIHRLNKRWPLVA